ncbi:MAG: MmgE/PrpD family protein, partial [Rhodospirillales bacterium]|nr:MmgE/PrpD family protein [Rhodospirillales bacterium]
MNVTKQLADFAAGLDYDDLPEEVRYRTRLFVLDGLGIMLGAVAFARNDDDRCLEGYLELTAPSGAATVVGMDRKTTPMMAAFANGTLSEVLDCQDTNIACRIHNGAAIIPAALAMGEVLSSSGRDLMAAAVAGYEIGCRLGLATQPDHWYSGFQITGTYNTCGSAATAGRLMGFGGEDMAAALGISGYIIPISNGDNVFKGHSIKPIHGGQPATCGISAAYLAQSGYRAGPLEGEPPRYHSPLHILGKSDPDLEAAVRGIGEVWHSLEVGFKPYPVGLFNIGPVEICLDLLAEKPIDVGAIDSVDVRTYHDAWKFTGEKYTTTESNYVDAHLSMPYSVAVTLMDGEMTPKQLAKSRLRDPAVHELAARVKVVEIEEMNAMYPHEWPLEFEVRFKDGNVRKKRIDQVKWSPRRPPP